MPLLYLGAFAGRRECVSVFELQTKMGYEKKGGKMKEALVVLEREMKLLEEQIKNEKIENKLEMVIKCQKKIDQIMEAIELIHDEIWKEKNQL